MNDLAIVAAPAHAVFSPSSSSRWFKCPGSIRMSAGIAPRTSRYADEGTAAHILAAACLHDGREPADYVGKTIVVDKTPWPVTEEMAVAVSQFTDLARVLKDDGYHLEYEVRLDLGHLHPGQFGTGDAVLYHPGRTHLVVIDLKYGAGVSVDPDDNPQLLSYASGAYRRIAPACQVHKLSLVIVQPRTPGEAIKKWNTTPERLAEFEGEFRVAVSRALNPTSPLIPGEHCRFCPAAPVCPALRNRALFIAQADFAELAADAEPVPLAALPTPASLPPQHIATILDNAPLLEFWLGEVRDYALAQMQNGLAVPGWKVVRKNTHRKWVDEDKTEQILASLYDFPEEDIYTRKLKSPAQVEKLLLKADRDSIQPLITKPPGEPTIAPHADRRPAIESVQEQFAGIAVDNN